jgi:predicted RND superfamily exporter protein
MLDNVMTWLVTALVLLVAGWGGVQKGRADRERKRTEEAEALLSRSKVQQSIGQVADSIKDELIVSQRENIAKQKKVVQAIDELEQKENQDDKARGQEQIVNDLNVDFNSRRRP